MIDGKVPRTACLVLGALHFLQNLKAHGIKKLKTTGTANRKELACSLAGRASEGTAENRH